MSGKKSSSRKTKGAKASASAVVEQTVETAVVEQTPEAAAVETVAEPEPDPMPQPRRSVAFIGSECYPFVKTGGLGDVMYALPKALTKQNCDVKVILPRYKCIPQKYQDKMIYRRRRQVLLRRHYGVRLGRRRL